MTIPSKNKKILKQGALEAEVSKTAVSAINRFTTEVIVAIVSFASSGRPFVNIPLRCIRFSWICRCWRVAILNNAIFWKYVILRNRTTLSFLKELIKRSKNEPLEIMIQGPFDDTHILSLIQSLGMEARRSVKSLYCVKNYSPMSDILACLPFLENIFSQSDYNHNITFETLCDQVRFKALQLSVNTSGNLRNVEHFNELRWLHLTRSNYNSIHFPPLLKALQGRPNLRVLHLSANYPDFHNEPMISKPACPIVTFHELKVLIMERCPIMHLINAPKLTYLDVSVHPHNKHKYKQFCGFDFSSITHIYTTLGAACDPYIIGKNGPTGFEDVSRCFSFNRSLEAVESLFDETPTSYPNQFRVSIDEDYVEEDEIKISSITACLKKATNVREIIMERFAVYNEDSKQVDSFFKALTHATSVRQFTVLSGISFQALCTFLGCTVESPCPNLEKLIYTSEITELENKNASHLLHCLDVLNMMWKWESSGTSLQIEVTGFDPVNKPEKLKRLKKAGLHLIQK